MTAAALLYAAIVLPAVIGMTAFALYQDRRAAR